MDAPTRPEEGVDLPAAALYSQNRSGQAVPNSVTALTHDHLWLLASAAPYQEARAATPAQ